MAAKTAVLTQQSSPVTKVLPVLLPLIAIGVVIFLGFRWYNLKTQQDIPLPEITPKDQIESLNPEEQTKLQNLARGVGDYESTRLSPVKPGVGTAEVRYEIKDERIYASIMTSLPPPQKDESYHVWLKSAGASQWQSSDFLTENKGGWMSTFVLPTDKLPVEIKITHEGVADQDPDQEIILFQGLVSST